MVSMISMVRNLIGSLSKLRGPSLKKKVLAVGTSALVQKLIYNIDYIDPS